MKKSTFIFLFAIGFGLTSYAQDYAKNSFGINTSGPFQGFGLQWNHQLTEKTTFTAYYGQAVPIEHSSDNAYYPNDDQTGQGYSGIRFENSSWTSFLLNYRPLENFQAFRVASGLGVARLGGTLQGLTDGNTYFINGAGPFAYMGIGYGLKPVEGFQWGVDIGWLRGPGFTTQTDGVDAAAAQASMELTTRNHESSFWPSAQVTIAWGF